MSALLFEIGTEELPPSAVQDGEGQLRGSAERLLAEARVPHGLVETFATPRRLAVLVRDLPERQQPAVEEKRGPPADKAFMEDGSFSPAAVGFARANEIEPQELVRKETDGGEYMFAVQEHTGDLVADVLPDVLAGVVESLSFPKTMRWDPSGVRFPRPIRWLVALLDTDVLDVRYAGLEAGRASTGHRVFHPGPIEIPTADRYEDTMREASVVARRDARREAVRTGATEAAAKLGGQPVLHPEVLDEVSDLVEFPAALPGRCDEAYLELPREVLVTVMESHQRYFPVEKGDGDLLAGFVVVSNADPANAEVIVSGNERVLRGRLEDARFFYREDLKTSLSARTERLSEVVVHARLGTLRDKVLRVGGLLASVAEDMGLSEDETSVAYFAADVYKADLLTQLVYEFPELEGVMGREYTLRDRELQKEAGDLLPRVAQAIYEHRLPRFPGDELPKAAAGAALGLADRLDTLVGYVGIGEAPSGSADPYALRRQATGFVETAISVGAQLSLTEALGRAYDMYAAAGVELEAKDAVVGQVREILLQRADGFLGREGIERVLIDAAMRSEWADLPDLADRARSLNGLHEKGSLHTLAVAHERAYNLSRDADGAQVAEEVLEHPSERDLYQQLVAVEEIAAERANARDYEGTLETLLPLAEVVDTFFDKDRGVLVMDPDTEKRQNRIALLHRTAKVFTLVADFSDVHPAELEGDGGTERTQDDAAIGREHGEA